MNNDYKYHGKKFIINTEDKNYTDDNMKKYHNTVGFYNRFTKKSKIELVLDNGKLESFYPKDLVEYIPNDLIKEFEIQFLLLLHFKRIMIDLEESNLKLENKMTGQNI